MLTESEKEALLSLIEKEHSFHTKRFQDQNAYIQKISRALLSRERKEEILKSASGVATYHNNSINQLTALHYKIKGL